MLISASISAATSTAFWYPQVVASLGDPDKAIWIPNAGLVASTCLTPILGLWSTFGSPTRKWISVVGALVGSIGLIVIASAP